MDNLNPETGSDSGSAEDSSDDRTLSSEQCDCDPAREVRFAFGPQGHYLFSTRDAETSSFRYYLRSATADQLKTISIGSKIFSASILADGGIIVACISKASDTPVGRLSYAGPQGYASAYKLVFNKVYKKIAESHLRSTADLSHINLTVGIAGSYITPTKDGPIWRDIPAALAAKIESSDTQPRQVALGRNNAWVCLWSDHTISYNLGTEYSDLADKLQRYMQANDNVAFVALNAYDDDSWFMVDCDGLLSWAFRGGNINTTESQRIQEMAGAYMQRRSRKTGIPFSYTSTTATTSKRINITPQTNYDKIHDTMSKNLPEPLSSQWMATRTKMTSLPLRQRSVMASSAVALSTATACGVLGMKMRPALAVGGIAGAVTLAFTSTSLDPPLIRS